MKILFGLCVVLLFAVAGVSGTQALLSLQDDEGARGGGGARSTPVGVTSPETRRIEDAVTAIGTLRPVRSVEIVPNAPGRVTAVPFSSGDEVAAGDLLIQLDDRAARAALADAEVTLSEARQDYRRIERLAQSNAAAESQLEAARADFRRAEAAEMASRPISRIGRSSRRLPAPWASSMSNRGRFWTAANPWRDCRTCHPSR